MYIQIQDEHGEKKKVWEGNFDPIYTEIHNLNEEDTKKYPWLVSIDPYGDTIFNYLQLPLVKKQFGELEAIVESKEIKQQIRDLVGFMDEISDVNRDYLGVVGD